MLSRTDTLNVIWGLLQHSPVEENKEDEINKGEHRSKKNEKKKKKKTKKQTTKQKKKNHKKTRNPHNK